jgi:hypothetical protein
VAPLTKPRLKISATAAADSGFGDFGTKGHAFGGHHVDIGDADKAQQRLEMRHGEGEAAGIVILAGAGVSDDRLLALDQTFGPSAVYWKVVPARPT